MGERSRVMLLMYMLIVKMICGGCNGGRVYKVGGSSAWTNINISPSHYKYWAASNLFHVGDTLLFEYNKEFHNVVSVTHDNFKSCNSTGPYETWATGNDSLSISRPAHFFFICSVPTHCRAGQKVDIRVSGHHKPKPGPSPLPLGPSPAYSPGPSVPSKVPLQPAHSPKSGSSSLHSFWKFWLLVLPIGLPAIA